MSSLWLQKLRNQISAPIGQFLISSRPDDVYIAAHPRSGSTWLRTILVNILDSEANSNPDVFNARIPAVSIRNALNINALASPRLIMTHGCWQPVIEKAVYLVRDGRDAFISSYHYHVSRQGLSMEIEQYFEQTLAHIYGPTWAQHSESWLKKGEANLNENIHTIRFEDLKANTAQVINQVCEFLDINASANLIANAIANASLKNARRIEQDRQGAIDNANASFYRGGETMQWHRPRYQKVIREFEAYSESALEQLGYLED